MRSRKPDAERFRQWVTGEVLPAIRKQGQYSLVAEHSSPAMVNIPTEDVETAVAEEPEEEPPLLIGTIAVRRLCGLFCLNDLHRGSGGDPNRKPTFFLRIKRTRDFMEAIHDENAVQIIHGQRGGTYACREMLSAYAAWIDPKTHFDTLRALLAAPAPAPLPLPAPAPERVPIPDVFYAVAREVTPLRGLTSALATILVNETDGEERIVNGECLRGLVDCLEIIVNRLAWEIDATEEALMGDGQPGKERIKSRDGQ
jgi:hypothetical protein